MFNRDIHMNFFTPEVCNIFRTVVIGGAIAGTALPLGSLADSAARFVGASQAALEQAAEPSAIEAALEPAKAELALPCVKYFFSKRDSKLEREAQLAIDEYFDGDVDHGEVCKLLLQ
nr:hypothetical protein 7 [Pelagibacteraceae bacterium]